MSKGENIASLFRTVGVILGGVVLSFVLAVVLTMTIAPHTGRLLGYQMGWIPLPTTSSRIEVAHQIRINTFVVRWIITPLIGVGVGLFVGLFQKSRPGLVAAICLMPETWRTIVPLLFYRISKATVPDLLSISCSILVAIAVWRFRNKKKPANDRPGGDQSVSLTSTCAPL